MAEILREVGDDWSRIDVSNHAALLDDVATEILEFARKHQVGRVADSATNVATFNFTEGRFRSLACTISIQRLSLFDSCSQFLQETRVKSCVRAG